MSRDSAIARAHKHFDSGAFKTDLARRVAIPTESQNPDRAAELPRYLETVVKPELEALGFKTRTLNHTKARGPFLYAERHEGADLPTVLGYGHGDVIRGLDRVPADAAVDHAGTATSAGNVVTAGGRVLGVTAMGADIGSARAAAYAAADVIAFDGMQLRRDIALRAAQELAR